MKFGDCSVISREENGSKIVEFSGNLDYKCGHDFINFLKKEAKSKRVIFDFANLRSLDYAAAILLKRNFGFLAEFRNLSSKLAQIFDFISDSSENVQISALKTNIFHDIGVKIVEYAKDMLTLSTFLGEFFVKFLKVIFNPKYIRLREISNHCNDAGIGVIFIVCLTSFLIGIVLAYIGADMLARFGVSIYIINIMGMMALREVGPLIAAIVIAGRSASSFTAQIGVMKITEEIDAMKTMNFDPFLFLSMPRIIAMVVIVPFIIFLADMSNLAGQLLVCYSYLDIPVSDYFERFKDGVAIKHLFVGLIKAPFFGAIIAIIGCMRGFEVSSNSQSLGKFTTVSVVNAIFWVICIDALFAIIFVKLGY